MKAALIIATLVWVNSAHADIVLDPNAIVQMLYAQQKMERAIQEIRDATEIVKTWEAEIDALSDTTGIYRLHSTNVVSQVLPFGATFLPNHSRCQQLPG